MNRDVFIAWQASTRSRVFSQILKAQLLNPNLSSNKIFRIFQYGFLMLITFFYLCAKNPRTIFVQLPPFYAIFPTLLYTKLFHRKLVCDCHSGIFLAQNFYQRIYLNIGKKLLKKATVVLIHNEDLQTLIPELSSNIVILEDPLIYPPTPPCNNFRFKIVIVSSGAKDEPISELINAARELKHIDFYLTGKNKKLRSKKLPENFFITGFLSLQKYESLLKSADLIVALTNRNYTVLCGAYEAVSLTKPLITSNTKTLKKYFPLGTMFTENNSSSIIKAINDAQNKLPQLQEEMCRLRTIKIKEWEEKFSLLKTLLKKTDARS
ncbi:MAG: hypothetical protein NZ601_02035 [candidate division WOR-3 bacterium]|nr:hypothetical protein [candidate division WOR-3 bacterium]MCX7756923.1 hypothetical protein [candidate division WOR-3 bacterium]MDW7987649.1 hypothetical protein [candidate division WOR-3 bacterium]